MNFNKTTLFPYLIYNRPFPYSNSITLHPVTMNDVVPFETFSPSILVPKNSLFHDKKIIRMSYLDFLTYSAGNLALEEEYKMPGLSEYYLYAIRLLQLCCPEAKIQLIPHSLQFSVNGETITPEIFEDIRRIIIIQNDIDFDPDEFINNDTKQRLLHAQKALSKDTPGATIEDYIDSLVIAMNCTEEHIMQMTVRKFWRYIRRYQLHEGYTLAKTGECSGMVTYKEPIRHWMVSLDHEDKFKDFKTDENSLRGTIHSANN